jgi:transcription initiation factor TFIIIB Brf1 subunit/transcription initiation factor TFIIB
MMNCPACKSEAVTAAHVVVPRIEDDVQICIDCGCLFADIKPWVRDRLYRERWLKTQEAGKGAE